MCETCGCGKPDEFTINESSEKRDARCEIGSEESSEKRKAKLITSITNICMNITGNGIHMSIKRSG